ncbi:hypothetical protein [Demequina sp. NBRC 110051]|uniref:hypothetical protein n=1 Tax=Demequina sp. NBRC 110051 TaxID=1570340 RepID=UPI000A06BA49|nr:hypothetical protein [Demequina sp. NBRC 110051]
MAFPSIRTVAVAAGFLGLTMIVAGTATAMAGAQDGGAVGTGIKLTQVEEPAATPAPAASRGADMIPGMPIEVGADPLLTCDAEGDCSSAGETPAPAAPAAAATDAVAKPVAATAATADQGATDTAVGKRADDAGSERDGRGDQGSGSDNADERGRGALHPDDRAGPASTKTPERASHPTRASSPSHARAGRH